MKKAILFLSTLLLLCGFAWSQGVTVSGAVTLPAGIEPRITSGYAVLMNADGNIVKRTQVESSYNEGVASYTYSFAGVGDATYSIRIAAMVYVSGDVCYSKTETDITVSGTAIADKNIELAEDGEHVLMTVMPQKMNSYGYGESMNGVQVSCLKKDADENTAEQVTTPETGDPRVMFYCDTLSDYVVTLKKAGYKDTAVETKAWGASNPHDPTSKGALTLNIVMQEDWGEEVSLSGTVTLGSASNITLPEKLQLVCQKDGKTKTLYSAIANGQYSFSGVPKDAADTLSVVEEVNYGYSSSYSASALLQIKSPEKGGLDLTTANGTATHDIELERVAVRVVGNVKDSVTNQGLGSVKVKIGELEVQSADGSSWGSNEQKGDFVFAAVKGTSLSVQFSKDGYATVTKDTTIDMAKVGADGKVDLGSIVMAPRASEFTFTGKAGIRRPSGETKDLAGVIVELWSGKSTGYGPAEKVAFIASGTTDAEGVWTLKHTCFLSDMLVFVVKHDSIEPVEQSNSASSFNSQMQYGQLNFYGEARKADLPVMENIRIEQIPDTWKVKISWSWPDTVVKNYGTTYGIRGLSIKRTDGEGAGNTISMEASSTIASDTVCIDSTITAAGTYSYSFQVMYYNPYTKTMEVPASAATTVTVVSADALVLTGSIKVGADTAKAFSEYIGLKWKNDGKDTLSVVEVKDGAYRFEGIMPGRVVYFITNRMDYPLFGISKNFEMNPEDTVFNLAKPAAGRIVTNDIVLNRVAVSVVGKVTNEAGSPVSGVNVKMADRVTSTDFMGQFTLSGIKESGELMAYKDGYDTLKKNITINLATAPANGQIEAGELKLQAKTGSFVFYGTLRYIDSIDEATHYVRYDTLENAWVTMWNEQKTAKLDSVRTDAKGFFKFNWRGAYNTSFKFTAVHDKIEPAEATAKAQDSANYVEFSLQAKAAELLTMENAKAQQVGKELKVELTWSWPEALKNGYMDKEGEGTYLIQYVKIYRQREGNAKFDTIATIAPDSSHLLPATSYVDDDVLLMYNRTYQYSFEIQYVRPTGKVRVEGGDDLKVTLSQPAVVPDSVVLTLNVNNAAYGTVTGAGKYEKGEEVTVKATANNGYRFVNWKSGEIVVATTAEYKFILSSDSTLTANFEANAVVPDSVVLTLNVNNAAYGSVTGAGKYEKGDEVTIKATANNGYKFVNWKSGEIVVATTAEYKFILSSDSTLTANFEANAVVPDSVVLTLKVNNAAYGSVTGAGKYEKGEEVTVKATANNGYVFVAWMDGTDTASKAAEYKFEIEEDLTLTAVFAQKVGNDKQELASWNAYVENGQIVLTSSIPCQYAVYNVSGMLIKQGRMNAGRCLIDAPKSGLYLIRRVGTGVSVRKVMVR